MEDFTKLKSGYRTKHDAMSSRAHTAFGDLVNPKRAAIQESASAKDSTPVRKFAQGGVVNEKPYKGRLMPGVRPDGKLYKKGGKVK